MNAELQTLVGAVRRRAPDLVDEWEATAWIESFGWSDDRVRAAFGLSDTRALGRYVYECSTARVPPAASVRQPGDRQTALAIVAGAYTSTLVYALPWLVTFAVEGLWPDAFDTQPDMAGPISVAVMVSLIATGGFVQAIARKGSFYLGMQQVVMARHVAWLLCRAGLVSTLLLAGAGLIAGTYFNIFESTLPRLVALFYFVMLSALWLACAMLSLQAPRWRVPLVFVAAGLVFTLVKVNLGAGALVAQTAALAVAVLAAGGLCWDLFRSAATRDSRTGRIVLPRIPILVYALLPHFIYGVAYFTFVFADRLSAGSALPPQSGLPFGIAPDYKRGIDLAFLVFLIVAGAVECCNLLLMRFWREQAEGPSAGRIDDQLARQRRRAQGLVVALFVAAAAIASAVAAEVQFLSAVGQMVFVAGCAGYALFAAALLDGLMLFSLNRPAVVLRALLPALVVNLITGYVLSHVAGAEFAVVGLVAGAGVFAFGTRRGVRDALKRPDFAYGWA